MAIFRHHVAIQLFMTSLVETPSALPPRLRWPHTLFIVIPTLLSTYRLSVPFPCSLSRTLRLMPPRRRSGFCAKRAHKCRNGKIYIYIYTFCVEFAILYAKPLAIIPRYIRTSCLDVNVSHSRLEST